MAAMKKQPTGTVAAAKIDELVAGLDDWRGELLAQVRILILDAVAGVEETWKWMGSPVWEKDGIIAVGNAHKQKVKLTFPHGAHLPDPDGVFNNGFGAQAWRAIDLHQGDTLNIAASKRLYGMRRLSTKSRADRSRGLGSTGGEGGGGDHSPGSDALRSCRPWPPDAARRPPRRGPRTRSSQTGDLLARRRERAVADENPALALPHRSRITDRLQRAAHPFEYRRIPSALPMIATGRSGPVAVGRHSGLIKTDQQEILHCPSSKRACVRRRRTPMPWTVRPAERPGSVTSSTSSGRSTVMMIELRMPPSPRSGAACVPARSSLPNSASMAPRSRSKSATPSVRMFATGVAESWTHRDPWVGQRRPLCPARSRWLIPIGPQLGELSMRSFVDSR